MLMLAIPDIDGSPDGHWILRKLAPGAGQPHAQTLKHPHVALLHNLPKVLLGVEDDLLLAAAEHSPTLTYSLVAPSCLNKYPRWCLYSPCVRCFDHGSYVQMLTQTVDETPDVAPFTR